MAKRIATGIWFSICLGGAVAAQECPAAMPFAQGDSLADLSARCGVSSEAILRANGVTNEAELHTVGAVAIPRGDSGSGNGFLERAGTAIEETARQTGAAATEAGRAASDYVSGTDLGQGIMDALDAPADAGPRMDVQRPAPGQVRIDAVGLRAGQQVIVTAMRRGEVLAQERATADADGTVSMQMSLAGLGERDEAFFVLEATDDDFRLTATLGDG